LGLDITLIVETIWKAMSREEHSSAACSKQRCHTGAVSCTEMPRANMSYFRHLCHESIGAYSVI